MRRVLLVFLFLPSAAAAQTALSRVWVDARDPKTVRASLPGKDDFALFDAGLRSEKGFAPPPGWRVRAFSLPELSPEGRRVAFKAAGESTSALGVFRVESNAARVLDTDCDAQASAWSPDGRWLAVEDSKGLLNNSLRVIGDDGAGQLEISGDVLAELGFSAYAFRSDREAGLDVWRTQVYGARWLSARSLAFKVRRVHVTSRGGGKPAQREEEPESWTFDVVTKAFVKR